MGVEQAGLAWGCSGCFRCREACDHRNPVTETLLDARADYVARGQAPESIAGLLSRREQIESTHLAAVERLRATNGVSSSAGTALLLGCRYARDLPEVARDAIRLASGLLGSVRLASGCCGAWQDAAGVPEAAAAARARLTEDVGSARLVVLDPGCALPLGALRPLTLVELASRHRHQLTAASAPELGRLRYHDACALGRGLGLYDEPRELLTRVSGQPPLEFELSREQARCSGAGGLLPISMPDVAEFAAVRRRREHERLGGGTVVSGCASSLSNFRKYGIEAMDLISVLARGLKRNA